METNTEYILVPKATVDAFELSKEHTLTVEEVAKLTANAKLIKKYIEQKALSIQFDIGTGKWEQKTDLGLALVEQLAKIAVEIGDIKTTFNQYLKELKEKEKQEKENIEE